MRILIAEDDRVSRRLLEAKLANWGYEVVLTCDGEEAWEALQAEDPPRLAILDWMMPRMDGVEICRRMRMERREPYIYVILLTALHGDDDLVTGMEAGADDYIMKPFKANELKVRLRAGRRIIELQEELIEAREALREKATHDPLTGLWNHGEIVRILERQLCRAQREGCRLTLLMADLDHFKAVNDTYGHLAGDKVLRITAGRMLSLVRKYDYVGRYGGEEFMLVLPGCDRDCAVDFAERIRHSICAEPMDIPDGLIPVSISVGAGTFSGEYSVDDLIKKVDDALYQAKKNGRNRVEMITDQTGSCNKTCNTCRVVAEP